MSIFGFLKIIFFYRTEKFEKILVIYGCSENGKNVIKTFLQFFTIFLFFIEKSKKGGQF